MSQQDPDLQENRHREECQKLREANLWVQFELVNVEKK